jgi:antirestriction protein ArdC
MVWRSTQRETTAPRDAMQEFADQIVAALEVGTKPWVRPWDPNKCAGPQAPFNPTTGAKYHGINVLILGISLLAFQTGDPRWCSFLQAKEKGWHVKKGAKATTIFFTKQLTVKDANDGGEEPDDDGRTIRMLKHYSVFHASQIEGIPAYTPPTVEEAPWTRPEAAQIILENSRAIIRTGGEKAFYSPSTDHIQLPPDNAFDDAAAFAAVFLHELCHWTGHLTRLNRSEAMKAKFGSSAYAMEELRAELSSAFLAAELGIPCDIPQHASYIADWLKPLKQDKREIFRAAADAQKIVDMVLGFHPDFSARLDTQPDRPRGPPDFQPEAPRPTA